MWIERVREDEGRLAAIAARAAFAIIATDTDRARIARRACVAASGARFGAGAGGALCARLTAGTRVAVLDGHHGRVTASRRQRAAGQEKSQDQ